MYTSLRRKKSCRDGSRRERWGDLYKSPPAPKRGKEIYSTLHGVCAEVLNDLKAVLKQIAAKVVTTNPGKEAEANDEFREQRRHKRNSSDDQNSHYASRWSKGPADTAEPRASNAEFLCISEGN